MRVIKAHDVETTGSRRPEGLDVCLGVEEKARRALSKIWCADGVGDAVGGSEQHPATLARLALLRVRDDGVDD